MRGSQISASTWRESLRGSRPPTEMTSMISSLRTRSARAQPYLTLIFSAEAMGVRRPKAMSLVRLLPPRAKTDVCLMESLENTARSVVPPSQVHQGHPDLALLLG